MNASLLANILFYAIFLGICYVVLPKIWKKLFKEVGQAHYSTGPAFAIVIPFVFIGALALIWLLLGLIFWLPGLTHKYGIVVLTPT